MKSRDFCYWLQGYFELCPPTGLTLEQVVIVGKPINLDINTKDTGKHFRIHNTKNSMYTDRVLYAVLGDQAYFTK
jgi:hypothetical protein